MDKDMLNSLLRTSGKATISEIKTDDYLKRNDAGSI